MKKSIAARSESIYLNFGGLHDAAFYVPSVAQNKILKYSINGQQIKQYLCCRLKKELTEVSSL